MEEQTSTTREIAESMQAAATAVGEVNTNLDAISNAVGDADTFAKEGTELYRSLQSNVA